MMIWLLLKENSTLVNPHIRLVEFHWGPNAAAVVVKSVSVVTAPIWRPTTTCVSLSQAVGVKIAWPSEKLILDDAIDLSKKSNTDGSEVNIICFLFFDNNFIY